LGAGDDEDFEVDELDELDEFEDDELELVDESDDFAAGSFDRAPSLPCDARESVR